MPPQIPRKMFPQKNCKWNNFETKIQRKIKRMFAVSAFMKVWKAVIRFNADTVRHFTSNYKNDTCDSFLELWDKDCQKQREKSIRILNEKEGGYLNNSFLKFCKFVQILKIRSKNDWEIWRGGRIKNQYHSSKPSAKRSVK